DVLEQSNYPLIQQVNKDLGRVQAFARPINFFYLTKGARSRIEQQGANFIVLNSDLQFTKQELEAEIENHPERFSPNVLLRPLFKELLLPNLAMIGGGAEVNYWMQLKSTFAVNKITYPILLLRNSALIVSDVLTHKIQKIGFKTSDFFSKEEVLHKRFIDLNKEGDIGVEHEKKQLEAIFDSLSDRVQDKGLQMSILAEKKKQLKSLSKMEQKLRKGEKLKHQTSLAQISKIKGKLFPNNTLQERYDNIIPFYLNYGESFIDLLKKELNPLEQKFTLFIDQ
ncbi:MAG: bacillithiol biosynthesis cysteine-adding enzyme BshC, partial [Flavobacteriales bacterium]|nr:bacillithiol biosynthesis cysteine-adding enzyme BshC [Flavobacteriales bacterium]